MAQQTEVLIIGAGISGLAAAKCMRDAGFSVRVVERTSRAGGLWVYREHSYGVMEFTHINVSKHNYCFSDFPIPDHYPDYLHNRDLAQFIDDYVAHFKLNDVISYGRQVEQLSKSGDDWVVRVQLVTESEDGKVVPSGEYETYQAKYVAVASGHHAEPVQPTFPGLDTFKGKCYHSVDFKHADFNSLTGKRVVIVGIGNSAIDIATHAASVGKCRPVQLSTRSGAWVVPNYLFGSPTDHYACRLFLWLPWRLASFIFETTLGIVTGSPKKWGLNPKMHALQTQPTVSPTLIHHIQRGEVIIRPDVQKVNGDQVVFTDGSRVTADHLILCTGYRISLPYLSDDLRSKIFNQSDNSINLYKNVFSPVVDHSLAFIGFVQPASGGVLTMAETQARWWAELCRKRIQLPAAQDMRDDIKQEMDYVRRRWFASGRHTIQRDPILYNDMVADFFGAKPDIRKYATSKPALALRLLLGSCGAAQWRLQGPGQWADAEKTVKSVPITGFLLWGAVLTFLFFLYLVYWLCSSVFGCCL